MNYLDHIIRAVDFIEDNLRNDIDISMCADTAGYSVYHFLRIFKYAVKETPASYIRKRRLTEIVKKMYEKAGSTSEIAYEYGFNSKENFIRAFVSEHHQLPTEYRTAANSLKLYERYSCTQKAVEVTPELVTLNSYNLLAYKSDEEFPYHFWNKYNCRNYSARLSGGYVCEDYGVSSWNFQKEKLDYYIGIRAENANGDISGAYTINIPAGLYAMFTTPASNHFDFVNTIHRTWSYINSTWLPLSGCKRTGGCEFETYLEHSRVFSEKIYVPIIQKSIQ